MSKENVTLSFSKVMDSNPLPSLRPTPAWKSERQSVSPGPPWETWEIFNGFLVPDEQYGYAPDWTESLFRGEVTRSLWPPPERLRSHLHPLRPVVLPSLRSELERDMCDLSDVPQETDVEDMTSK